MNIMDSKVAIIGLGYVGLPLAVEFGRVFNTIGFDISQSRIEELQSGHDATLEVTSEDLNQSLNVKFTSVLDDIKNCNFYIVTVPTPIDKHKRPDLTSLEKASASIGKIIKKGDIVIYESTVYQVQQKKFACQSLNNNQA